MGEHAVDGSQGTSRAAEIAYQSMAPAYDDFTAEHNYTLWVDELLKLGVAHGLHGDTALDVGCGTGKSFMPLVERGWKVTACDISPAMVDLARSKASDEVRIEVADMRALPLYGNFDLVCALDDVVNYLLTAVELEQALMGMAANLAPDGILIFDSNTLTVYRGFFNEHVEVEARGRRLVWDGHSGGAVEPGEISEATFSVEALESRAGSGSVIPAEVHRQRHHPETEVRAALAAAGLELVGLYGHHFDGIPHEPMSEDDHTKAIYVARLARTR
jgi:predicted TPR repeat methyltransferase